MKTLLEIEGLTKKYANRTVVRGVDLTISEKEVIAIIGPNGAGKTTILEMIPGIRRPDSGKIKFWREDFKDYIGVQLQSVPFFPGLTTKENLVLFASFYRVKLKENEMEQIFKQFSLTEVAQTAAAKISGGQQKRLAIALTTLHKPQLIFLDEPTAALDPKARQETRQLISSLNQSGVAVVFTSHDMEEVYKIAHWIIMIDNGQIQVQGEPEKLCKEHQVETLNDLYLKFISREER